MNLKNGLLDIFKNRGSILLQTMIMFFIFISVYTPIMTLTLLRKTQPELANKAFKRMDMEILALEYYHKNKGDLKHDDAIYEFNHWITYWVKKDKLTIWFDGFYDYKIEFPLDKEGNFTKKQYVYD